MPHPIKALTALACMAVGCRAEALVFKVNAYDCPGKIAVRSLTGFKLRQYDGIVTALHGVAGCTIKLAPDQGQPIPDPVKIIKVDIENDVALLGSGDVSNKVSGGFEISRARIVPRMSVHVKGHPLGISEYTKDLTLNADPIVTLRTRLPDADYASLAQRRSPATSISVLVIDGPIVPGHSGAPVLDDAGAVLGIANGGLLNGAAGISCAIPVANIRLSLSQDKDINELAKLDPAEIFKMDATTKEALPVSVLERLGAALRDNDLVALTRLLSTANPTQDDKDVALSWATSERLYNLRPQAARMLSQRGARLPSDILCRVKNMGADSLQLVASLPGVKANPSCGVVYGTPLYIVVEGIADGFRAGEDGEATLEKLKILLAIPGIDVNVKNSSGWTPLHQLAFKGRAEALEVLLNWPKIGLNLNARDNSGDTALDFACGADRDEAVRILAKKGVQTHYDKKRCPR